MYKLLPPRQHANTVIVHTNYDIKKVTIKFNWIIAVFVFPIYWPYSNWNRSLCFVYSKQPNELIFYFVLSD